MLHAPMMPTFGEGQRKKILFNNAQHIYSLLEYIKSYLIATIIPYTTVILGS